MFPKTGKSLSASAYICKFFKICREAGKTNWMGQGDTRRKGAGTVYFDVSGVYRASNTVSVIPGTAIALPLQNTQNPQGERTNTLEAGLE